MADQLLDQTERRRIEAELDRCLLVEAAAGTGKTTSLVRRLTALLRQGKCRADQLVAVTFTRKAAGELRSRFQLEVEQAAVAATGADAERLQQALSHLDRCFIGTIHSFCARLLRERPIEAGVDLAFEEMDEAQDQQLRAQAWDTYVNELQATDSPLWQKLAELGLAIEQLQPAYLQYATYPDVDEWPAPHVELGDLKAARRALNEYLSQMRKLVPTFPVSRGNDELMSEYERVERFARNRGIEQTATLLEVLQMFVRTPDVVQKQWPGGKAQAKPEAERWEEFAERHARPLVQRWHEHRYPTVMEVLREATRRYETLRRESGRLNYQDLLLRSATLLRDQPGVRSYFRRRYSHILVDEFQDTDPIQAQVLLYLTAENPAEQVWRRCRPVPGALFVVGDPKQSIYRFRRADIVTYNTVKQIIQDCRGEILALRTNFRTIEPVVAWNNRIFDETFPAEANAHSPAAAAMHVGRGGEERGELADVRVLQIPKTHSNKELAVAYDVDFVARSIRTTLDQMATVPRSLKEEKRGAPAHATPGDFMIITYSKKHLSDYGRRLGELGIPHEMSGGAALRHISELPLLLDCLRAVLEPENPVAFVALLRGALFGLSDADLFALRSAGVRFAYRAMLPDSLECPPAERYKEACARMQRYAGWLHRLPAVAAVERILADLGLVPSALAARGGNLSAGTMAKALEVLRSAGALSFSLQELLERFAEIVHGEGEFDAVPAQPHREPAVRLMNLHKAKGLEAPVVFLADPTGKWNPPIQLHIDRSGDRTVGYLAVHGADRGSSTLACPQGWEEHEASERRFRDAELQRLMYVAGTRVGSRLVVTQAPKNNFNHWGFFTDYLQKHEPLADPGEPTLPPEITVPVTKADVSAATTAIVGRQDVVLQPTYAVLAAKAVSLGSGQLPPGEPTAAQQGPEWGTVIHLLLETAAKQPAANLQDLATAALREAGLNVAWADRAVELVETVRNSEVWRRAQAASRRFVEASFTLLQPTATSVPTLLRGVIDLAFWEPDGWVIVDYKTDDCGAGRMSALVEYYSGQLRTYADCWRRITGEPVKEAALFFVREAKYVTVSAP